MPRDGLSRLGRHECACGVQDKLREAGLYFGEIDGAYSSELAAALGRY